MTKYLEIKANAWSSRTEKRPLILSGNQEELIRRDHKDLNKKAGFEKYRIVEK
jgi:hypothetical protein